MCHKVIAHWKICLKLMMFSGIRIITTCKHPMSVSNRAPPSGHTWHRDSADTTFRRNVWCVVLCSHRTMLHFTTSPQTVNVAYSHRTLPAFSDTSHVIRPYPFNNIQPPHITVWNSATILPSGKYARNSHYLVKMDWHFSQYSISCLLQYVHT